MSAAVARWWLLRHVARWCGYDLAAAAAPTTSPIPIVVVFSSDRSQTRAVFDLLYARCTQLDAEGESAKPELTH
jgi:hypothetical protein